jgi:NADH-quinone oxidoreductase subunit C
MPEESKGPEAVSPSPEGAGAPTQNTPSNKPETQVVQPEKTPVAPAKSSDATPAAPAAQPAEVKPAEAKPATPAAAKPAAPAAAKPAAPAKPTGPQPEPWNSDLVTKLKQQYGSGIREANTYVGQKYLLVDSGIVFEVLRRMCEDEKYDYCVDITATHWLKREQPFEIIYILYSFQHNQRIRIKAQIAEGQHLQSVVNVWPTANWLEREVFDMFGIVFDGHPDLKRILLPDGWKGHPLRKDYDILLQDKEWVQINLGIESGQ